ncbi:hypothetical protein BU26DRAFT_566224 [Trematosphaeria pertusa]|uniref:Uncharacterized protein n=1 Tax=Trematosphaeria pertusa TaxID=390896 RepID=A0A6A6ICG1_9PLEO|nr:uncharacterized protein BU26DRAFT_566224 [Trematosphaeria pertusa]KAF2247240.1 hypothetical protein BU26DRAFT_566224 [Trematosphaeria pertusa]
MAPARVEASRKRGFEDVEHVGFYDAHPVPSHPSMLYELPAYDLHAAPALPLYPGLYDNLAYAAHLSYQYELRNLQMPMTTIDPIPAASMRLKRVKRSNSSGPDLLSLPQEIRNQVYREILIDHHTAHFLHHHRGINYHIHYRGRGHERPDGFHRRGTSHGQDRSSFGFPMWFLTSKQILDEALDELFHNANVKGTISFNKQQGEWRDELALNILPYVRDLTISTKGTNDLDNTPGVLSFTGNTRRALTEIAEGLKESSRLLKLTIAFQLRRSWHQFANTRRGKKTKVDLSALKKFKSARLEVFVLRVEDSETMFGAAKAARRTELTDKMWDMIGEEAERLGVTIVGDATRFRGEVDRYGRWNLMSERISER